MYELDLDMNMITTCRYSTHTYKSNKIRKPSGTSFLLYYASRKNSREF